MLKVKYKWNEVSSWQTTPQFWCSAFCTKLQSPGEDMCNVQLCNCVIIYQITQSTIKLRLKLNSDRSSLGRLTSMFENLFFSNIFTKSESVRFGTESSPRPLKYKCRNDDYDINHVGPKLEQLTWLRCTISHLGLSNGLKKVGEDYLSGYLRVSLRRFGQNGRMMRRLPMLRFFRWSSW